MTDGINALLADELRRFACDGGHPPADWDGFVRAISASLAKVEEDRLLLERSMQLTSRELLDRNEQLRREMVDRARMEAELRLAHKLESTGQLAAGIAHEINTPIQYVGDSVSFLRSAFDDMFVYLGAVAALLEGLAPTGDQAELRRRVDEAADAADLKYLAANIPSAISRAADGVERVTTIVRAMKDFAHPDQPEMASADLNKAIQSTVTVARNEYKYVADLALELGDLPPTRCHLGQINQVLLNLIVNAAQAIGDKNGGTDARGLIRVRSRVDGGDVIVSVEDDGGGIPSEVQPRIFDPFFTTKEVGRGTGQGLSIARAIVVDCHGGALGFETAPGRGTTFHVRLPIDGPRSRRAA